MAFSPFWSRDEVTSLQPRKFIRTDQPKSAEWKIIRILSNDERPVERESSQNGKRPAYTSIKLLCRAKASPEQDVFVRIYKQIPYADSDVYDLGTPEARRQQACSFVPEELVAFKKFSENWDAADITPRLLGWKEETQDDSAPVPGGFMTWIAWEKVPGVPLGDNTGSAAFFWGLERAERDEIRRVFRMTLPRIERVGTWQAAPGPEGLIWNPEAKLITFVGWREWFPCTECEWSPIAFLIFDLARAPPNSKHYKPGWNGDISKWTL